MSDVDQQRLMLKVARLYHMHGQRQTDIARRLQISQSRVSRLLSQAEAASMVRTVVSVPPHIHAELEEQVEARYGVREVHVVDVVSTDEVELARDLAHATAALLQQVAFEAPTIGFTSWSRTLRLTVDALQPLRTHTRQVVETLGDLGPPDLQHTAALTTQSLATLAGGQAVFLRTPAVVADDAERELILDRDPYAREALALMDTLDLVMVSIGACELNPALRVPGHHLDDELFDRMRELGAVGEVCLHFIDADGRPVAGGGLDDRIIGITRDQVKAARRRWAAAGGVRKHHAVRAALAGGWVDTLVTDTETAAFLVG